MLSMRPFNLSGAASAQAQARNLHKAGDMKQQIDLNSDLGEDFGPWLIGDGVDDEIMPLISSANIATGFHAGDPNTMHRLVGLAAKHNVGVGAHPGFRELVGFGRRHIKATDD